VPSDIRLKKDTSVFIDGLSVIKKIRPIKYKYNGLAGTPADNQECIGISAQAMQSIVPQMVKIHKKELVGDEATKYPYPKTFLRTDAIALDGVKGQLSVPVYEADILVFNPSNFIYILINSVKELDAINTALKNDVADLKARLDTLEKKIK
jgi:hypothetical protein